MKSELVLAFVFFTVFKLGEGIGPCNETIINNIRSRNGCQTDLLNALHRISNFTYVYNVHGTVPPTVHCAKGGIDQVHGCTARARVFVEYSNKSLLIQNYEHQVMAPCGVIKETDEYNKTFLICPIFEIKECFCYYRCFPKGPEGEPFAACACPMADKDDRKCSECCEKCKKEAGTCGIQTVLDKLTRCTE